MTLLSTLLTSPALVCVRARALRRPPEGPDAHHPRAPGEE